MYFTTRLVMIVALFECTCIHVKVASTNVSIIMQAGIKASIDTIIVRIVTYRSMKAQFILCPHYDNGKVASYEMYFYDLCLFIWTVCVSS